MPSNPSAREDQRQDAVLTALAKLEMRLRKDSATCDRQRDMAHRRGLRLSESYMSGSEDAYRVAAQAVADLYNTLVIAFGDPLSR